MNLLQISLTIIAKYLMDMIFCNILCQTIYINALHRWLRRRWTLTLLAIRSRSGATVGMRWARRSCTFGFLCVFVCTSTTTFFWLGSFFRIYKWERLMFIYEWKSIIDFTISAGSGSASAAVSLVALVTSIITARRRRRAWAWRWRRTGWARTRLRGWTAVRRTVNKRLWVKFGPIVWLCSVSRMTKLFSIYLPLELDTDPRRLVSRERALWRDLSLSLFLAADGESERMRLALQTNNNNILHGYKILIYGANGCLTYILINSSNWRCQEICQMCRNAQNYWNISEASLRNKCEKMVELVYVIRFLIA